jgi:hypothetical protein
MRHIAVLFILVLFAALGAGAQSILPLAPSFSLDSTPAASAGIRTTPFAPAPDLPLPASSVVGSAAASSTPLSLSLAPAPAPQDVTSVFQTYNWQAYLGYTFFRFYELPGSNGFTQNTNGFDINMVYYFKNWVGAEGDLSATHSTQNDESSWFAFGGGGPRFRWSARRGIELWAHALVGYSHFTPQTAFGSQHALAYTFGGGVDLPFKPRWSLRVGADAVGSQYFSTHQWSPKASVGVVFKF